MGQQPRRPSPAIVVEALELKEATRLNPHVQGPALGSHAKTRPRGIAESGFAPSAVAFPPISNSPDEANCPVASFDTNVLSYIASEIL